ncbi:flippase [Mucilaginibacter daejeonensis]|uniref:flippase n=1 Tax=Mucilaginibacter daejeonensis TaxID=398049 RepID=UPI001D178AE1|nr:flippase [Mucilaginibacter daejeonensis]UEG54947.1 flippase [Mucilaginibacter daejeonensis]
MKKNLLYNILLTVSQFILPLISFPYASRIIGPQGIGTVNFVDSFTQYFVLIAALGIPYYGVREIAKVKDDNEKKYKLFSEIFFIHIVSAVIISLVYLLVSLFIPQLHRNLSLVYIGVSIIMANVFSLEWFFQGIGEYSYIAIRSILVRSLSVLLLFVLLKNSKQVEVYYLILASVFILNGISNFLYIHKKVRISFSNLKLDQHFKPLLVILSSSLAISVYVYIDNILLGFLQNDEAVGYYSTSVKIVKIPLALLGAISTIIIPQISNFYHKGNIDEVRSLIDKSFNFVCLFGLPVMIGLTLNAEFLITIFAGEKFKNAIIIVEILSPIIFLIGLNNLFGVQILTPIGKEKFLLRGVIVGMIFSLIINLLLVPKYSYIGSAIANVITEIIVTAFCFKYSKKFIKYTPDLKVLSQSFFVSILFYPIHKAVGCLQTPVLYKGLFSIVACATIYLAFFLFLFKNKYIDAVKHNVMKKLSINKG